MESDENLILRIKQGDTVAFNALFDYFYIQLYLHCRKFISDPEDAKDILQNVFLRFWEKRREIDIHTSISAYLYKAVQNECLNHLRSGGTFVVDSWDGDMEKDKLAIVEANDPYMDLSLLDIGQIVENTIEKLPGQCQFIFKLSRVQGLKNQEIADKMGISVRTVETQIYRALKILKERLKDYLAS